ncbi:GFA family protein [Desulforhopalus sp. 52FAK]
MNYSNTCSCGKIQIKLTLPKPIEEYTPRACDCDFCTTRKAAYISDPDGVLEITQSEGLESLIQGSKQAKFWQCKSCHDLIAVTHEFETGLQGAINANCLAGSNKLQNPISVSPKTLSPEEKIERWQAGWMTVKFIDK